jgi:hypothetical protein
MTAATLHMVTCVEALHELLYPLLQHYRRNHVCHWTAAATKTAHDAHACWQQQAAMLLKKCCTSAPAPDCQGLCTSTPTIVTREVLNVRPT